MKRYLKEIAVYVLLGGLTAGGGRLAGRNPAPAH